LVHSSPSPYGGERKENTEEGTEARTKGERKDGRKGRRAEKGKGEGREGGGGLTHIYRVRNLFPFFLLSFFPSFLSSFPSFFPSILSSFIMVEMGITIRATVMMREDEQGWHVHQ
jgi:hypothetical protein